MTRTSATVRSVDGLASAGVRFSAGALAEFHSRPTDREPGDRQTLKPTSICSASTSAMATWQGLRRTRMCWKYRSTPAIRESCMSAAKQSGAVRESRHESRAEGHLEGEAIRLAATSRVWPLAFPQHGSGKKHERAIGLVAWQQDLVTKFPGLFLRGLIHSDGSRVTNRFRVALPSGSREYAYPRYFFTNLSTDIQGLFCATCEQLGVRWTQSSHKNISIADRRSVALLDSFVGPKTNAGGGT